MSSPSIRTILPLAVITCTGMLAMDLYLPAVPALQRGLDLTVAQGQATVSVFLAGLAASQLVWGEATHRFGPRACVKAGLWMLIAASFGCALAADVYTLLGLRLAQGIAAGAATVVSPTVIRATLPDRDGVRGIAAIAMIEAIIPAAGPALGTVLLLVVDWRWIFVLIGALALLSVPFALRATPAALPQHAEPTPTPTGYLALLRNARFVRLAAAHALGFGALMTFVASGPQVLRRFESLGSASFATAQVCGVAAFIAVASRSGRISARIGAGRAVQAGAAVQLLLCAALLLATVAGVLTFPWLLAFWMMFCGALGMRGPAAVSDALAVPTAQMGRASALLVLALLIGGAVGTQAAAPFLDAWDLRAVAGVMALLCGASLALVWRYP